MGVLTEKERREIADELRMACMRVSRRSRFENVDSVAPHQFSVLCKLRDEQLSPGQLAAAECVSAPSMTRTLAGLAEQGLVERIPDEHDGRRSWVRLTAAGRDAVDATKLSRDRWMQERVTELSDEECRVLERATEILARVVAR